MPGGPDDPHSDARMALWRRARHMELCESHVSDETGAILPPDVLEGPGFLYRPRQILLEAGVMKTQPVESELKKHGGYLDTDLSGRFAAAGLPILAYRMPPEVYLPGLVEELRRRPYGEWGAPAANVSANHVFCGEPGDYHGGPYGEPLSASPFTEAPGKPAGGLEIAVLDTGYDLQIQTLHPGLEPRVGYQPGTEEDPYITGGYLAQEAGHGTFIDGIIMQLAPQVSIRQVTLLNPAGVTDDACLALAISALGNSVPVINVSLGGYAQGDVAPPASSAAIAALPDTVVVVAAAGNNGSNELFWPAALKSNNVVSVGALDTTQGAPQVADFSNYGTWVDVYAPGTKVYSTYLQANWLLPNDNPPPRPIDGWATWSGTSFAAPQVAAAIANTLLQSGGTALQAALAVRSQARWTPVTGLTGITGVMAYTPPGPGVIFPA
jgi:Subtilase family